ncbi:hypothetical protein [Streptomyces sp. NPDC058240]|uniref:LexA family protein n=1 Tax=Streptomyces sp. NPDC058240 TaxID=3346396 RepID=UPI0036E58043
MTRPDALSARQEAILRTIRDWIAETGESPSVRQIGERVRRLPARPPRSPRTGQPHRPPLALLPPRLLTTVTPGGARVG